MKLLIIIISYIFFAPLIGGFLTGIDRRISARMQRRVGPPLLQPFYDVRKLFQKENVAVRRSQNYFVFFYLIFVVFVGALFFTGGDLLLIFFALTLADIFFVLGGFKTSSPYSHVGANRELIQIMSYEPMMLFTVIGMYMVTKSFNVSQIVMFKGPMIIYLLGIFIGLLYVITIKFRKSPFDLSMSHHAHQELISGITTEFSGKTLGLIEISHWYEKVFILGIVYLFFSFNPILAIIVGLATYFLEIFIDNSYARVKWQFMLKSSWIVALVFGLGNILVLMFIL
ncbi:MAG TPA: Ech hydrogenase subunit EchB [Candidatus Margulisbacteria bacterium]|nr:MAG: Ech hydrogenase subunit EchB [Candidatus Margulisbacteria bacterium GWD2_39_127]HAR63538.1 Ech hydrogenase subunit EchB [Candidatus Margulisiibacteriota bacterium]